MDRELLLAALRVLTRESQGVRANSEDVHLVRNNALPEESNLPIEDVSSTLIRRLLADTRHPPHNMN